MKLRLERVSTLVLVCLSACGGDGTGTARFTTWGEEYIEQGIPADPSGQSGFVDGWTLKYTKFLVALADITVADDRGQVAATWGGSKLVDNVVPGRKVLVEFPDLDARNWNRVSYRIKPPVATTELVGATPADLALMVNGGYAVYVEGSATRGVVTKTFHWGFAIGTQYKECEQAAESGKATAGIVVKSGGIDTSELTTHGDHLFYDRLKASPDPAIKTVLRFDQKAAADVDGDGEITLAELRAAMIDVRTYDPSGFDAPTLGAFMTSLARTIGHFRGEGECTIAPLP